jgi:hypothetical protein
MSAPLQSASLMRYSCLRSDACEYTDWTQDRDCCICRTTVHLVQQIATIANSYRTVSYDERKKSTGNNTRMLQPSRPVNITIYSNKKALLASRLFAWLYCSVQKIETQENFCLINGSSYHGSLHQHKHVVTVESDIYHGVSHTKSWSTTTMVVRTAIAREITW